MSTEQPQAELLNIQTSTAVENGNNKQSNSEIKRIDKIENTPFAIVEVQDKGAMVALGNMRITDWMTREEAEHAINNKTWQLLFGVIQTLVTIMMHNEEYSTIVNDKLEKGGINMNP